MPFLLQFSALRLSERERVCVCVYMHPHPAEALVGLVRSVPAAGDTAHDVVLQTATGVDNRIIFDIMLEIISVVVIFITSTIKEQLAPSPSPYNPHN